METDKVEAPDGMTTDSRRREALKRFARYAAVAPTMMILLEPTESAAGTKKRKKGEKGGGY
jgi:hypothetical protein